MFKNYFLVLACLAGIFSSAQELPLDFESPSHVFLDSGASTQIVQDPRDANNNVLEIVSSAAQFGNGELSLSRYVDFTQTNKTITFDFYVNPASGITAMPGLLQFTDALDGSFPIEVPFSATPGWNTYSLDFNNATNAFPNAGIPVNYSQYSKIVFFPDFNSTSTGTYLMDDLAGAAPGILVPTPPATAPTTASPVPTVPAVKVLSMFSEAYTDVAVDTWRTGWSNSNFNDVVIDNNDMKFYSNLAFAGVETIATPMDLTDFDLLVMDVWTPNSTEFRVKLVDGGGDAFATSGNNSEGELRTYPTVGEWSTIVVPLEDFTNSSLTTNPGLTLTNKSDIVQFIISSDPSGTSDVYLDNIFFAKVTDFEYSSSTWTPNVPNLASNPSSQYDDLDVLESVTLPQGDYSFKDVNVNGFEETLDLASGSTLRIYGDLNTPDGSLNTQNSTLVFHNQREDNSTFLIRDVIADDVQLNNAELFFTSTGMSTFQILGELSAVGGKASRLEVESNAIQDFFKLADNGTKRGSIDPTDLSITGDMYIEEYFEANRAFRFVGSMVNNTTSINDSWMDNKTFASNIGIQITGNGGDTNGFDTTISNNPSLFTFNNLNSTWNPVNNVLTEQPIAGDAYRVFVRGDRTVDLNSNASAATATVMPHKGSLLLSDYTLPSGQIPSESVLPTANFMFVGNPFAYDIKIGEAFADSDFNAAADDIYYIWDPKANTQGAYRTYSNTGGTNPVLTGTVVNSDYSAGVLKMGQAAFFVRSTVAADNNFVLKQSLKGNTFAPISAGNPFAQIKIELYDSTQLASGSASSMDAVTIYMDNSFNNSITISDAHKFVNIDENLSRITADGYRLAVETREMPVSGESLQLDFYNQRQSDYTFKLAPTHLVGMDAFLVDNFIGTRTLLNSSQDTTYSFMIDTANSNSISTGRFEINFQDQTLGVDNGIAFAKAVKIYPNPSSNGILNIDVPFSNGQVTKVSLYNMQGQLILSESVTVQNITVKTSSLRTGIYIAKVVNGDQEYSTQVAIQN